jgi:hypothetical protein
MCRGTGVKADRFMYADALALCSCAGRLREGNAVYARCGDMGEAWRVF